MNKLFAIVLATFAMISTATASDIYVTGQVNHTRTADTIHHTTGGGLGIGYNFNNWLAVEGTYENLGKESQSGTSYTIRSTGAWVVVDPTLFKVAAMPVKALGRLGYTYTAVNTTNYGSDYDVRPAFGAGLALGITTNMDVTLEYRFRDFTTNGDVNLDTMALGLTYNF